MSDPEFCESEAFGAGLTALDGYKLAYLSHVCSASPVHTPESGAAQSSLKIGVRLCSTQTFEEVGLLGLG